MMDIRETISVAIDALRANKLRAILTSLGVIIASASIVLVFTVALTSKKFVLSQIESIGSTLVSVELVQRSDKPPPLSYDMTLYVQEHSVLILASRLKSYTCLGVVRLRDGQAARPQHPPSLQRQVGQLLRSRHPAEGDSKLHPLTATLAAARNIALALTIVLISIA